MNVFIFDIETVPDVVSGRRLHNLDGLTDKEVANIMFHKRREETGGSDFLRLHLQRIVAISVVFRSGEGVKVWSLGEQDADEKELIQRFFDGIEKFSPTLVSWNGGGFDLPVLHYRALLHGVRAPRYWETGDNDQSFRWNNYLSRFHSRHTDLMDVVAGYQTRANAPLPPRYGIRYETVTDRTRSRRQRLSKLLILKDSGEWRIRTSVGMSRQIYSLIPLSTRATPQPSPNSATVGQPRTRRRRRPRGQQKQELARGIEPPTC